jgi:hypothetical protein
MKQLFTFLVASVVTSGAVKACDLCGGGVSNSNPFMFPHLAKTYLGLSYSHKSFRQHSGIETSTYHYNSILVTAQVSLSKKFMVTGMIPYEFNSLSNDHGVKKISGLGDVSLLANYKLWTKAKNQNRQTILIGAGIELPTHVLATSQVEQSENQNFQLSSGSIDYILNASYHLSRNQFMFSVAGSYKYNTANKEEYRYGDILTTAGTLVYRKDWLKMSVSPYVQLMYETQMKDASNHIIQNSSGGQVLYTGGGVDINTKNIAVGMNYQFAPHQNLAQGLTEVKPRCNAHISFIL